MNLHAPWHVNLAPQRRVEAALAQPLTRFVSETLASGLLLVSLKNTTNKLIKGLNALEGEPPDPTVSDIFEPKTGFGEPLRQTWPADAARMFDESALAGIVQKSKHFVVAIRKRPQYEHQEPGRVTVGRSNDLDIVLNDPTVSKLHAWFEMQDDGSYWVTDQGSRNGTRLNGQRIPQDRAAPLEPGDQMEFGLVRCVFCPADLFWRALHTP